MLSQRQYVVGAISKKQNPTLLQTGRNRTKQRLRGLENHYYECIYDIIAQNIPHEKKLPRLNRLKANIVKMHSVRLQTVMLDTHETDRMNDEHPTIYHILQNK